MLLAARSELNDLFGRFLDPVLFPVRSCYASFSTCAALCTFHPVLLPLPVLHVILYRFFWMHRFSPLVLLPSR